MIMLVSSATASSTSSFTDGASVISMAEQIRQATAGEQVKLPVPAQLPAMPMNETTPSLGSACGRFDRHLSAGKFAAQHRREDVAGRPDQGFDNQCCEGS